MRIAVIGAGYVGLVVSVCFACAGHQVICLEKEEKRCQELNNSHCPIIEKYLPQKLVRAIKNKNLYFTTQIEKTIPDAEIIFIAVGTPSSNNGEAELSDLHRAISEIGQYLRGSQVVVLKSSVPPGTTSMIFDELSEISKKESSNYIPKVVCNPEFLREGNAVSDFLYPDRIIIGTDDAKVRDKLISLYQTVVSTSTVIVTMSSLDAELTKYASNSYLAVRLSFINELAGLCEKLGGNIKVISNAMGLDHRIGEHYLSAGLGYGGACLPKDTSALVRIGRKNGTPLTVLENAISANQFIPVRLTNIVAKYISAHATIAIWGLAFKAETNDIRNSPVIPLLKELHHRLDCHFQIFDPAGDVIKLNCSREFQQLLCETAEAAINGADALIVGTAWPQFKEINTQILQLTMRGNDVFDFCNTLSKDKIEKAGLIYHSCGTKIKY